MIIIGMTGPIGHGKSTFAKALLELEPTAKHFESSLIVAEVANALHSATNQIPSRDDIDSVNNWLRPLPSILLSTVHAKCNFEQLALTEQDVNLHPVEYEKLFLHIQNLTSQPNLLKQDINKANKEQYRPILQWLGGYLVQKVDPAIWYKEIIRRVYAIGSNGAKLCVIGGLRFPTDAQYVRQAGGIVVKVYRPGHLQYDMLDPTERERENIVPDTTLVSNGTIDDVKRCARQVIDDLNNNRLQKIYYAAGHKN
ncbi:MAG: hypothetical protein ACXWLH_02645 [Candidatus Saccharimonadales bacterium]